MMNKIRLTFVSTFDGTSKIYENLLIFGSFFSLCSHNSSIKNGKSLLGRVGHSNRTFLERLVLIR